MKAGTPRKAMTKPWKAPIDRAEGNAGGEDDDPGDREVVAEDRRQNFGLQRAHDHGEKAEQRADRQVDVAR